jgi:hypothetical protein
MKTLVQICFIFLPISAMAIGYPYDWDSSRKPYSLTDKEKSASEIILFDHLEYVYALENDQFVMYSVVHRIARVNSSEAIQRHNRVRISLERTFELVELKARALTPSGKVINFDKTNLKELNDEETSTAYRIFAMEGVEVGSEIEYFYVRKMSPNIFSRVYFQMDVPVKNASFVLKSPKNLEFEFQSYHGLPKVEGKLVNEQNVYELVANDLEPISDEPFAYKNASNKRIEFKLSHNKSRSFAEMYTFDHAGKEFYNKLYSLTKDDEKAMQKFVKALKDDPAKDQQSRIRSIERQIKSSVQVNTESNDESLKVLASITKYKVASPEGITRLYIHTFQALKIPVQVVLTCNRENRHFDESFDSWNFLDDYFLYFPEPNTFLSPYDIELTSPIIDPQYTGHKGLFIEPIEIGSLKSALTSVKEIPAAPWNYNTDNLDITMKFAPDLSANDITVKRHFKGSNAGYITSYYHLMTEEQRSKMIEELMSSTAPGLIIKKWSGRTNFEGEVDEFIFDVNFASSHFLERAGPRVLFKIGLIIGPQSELYQESERKLPIENAFNRGYERTITVTIPDGYTIKNPDDLNFNVTYKDGEQVPFSFVSSYRIEGQQLILTINEYYKQLYAPLDRYEDYRKVINAAADFNKVTLILEKKKG